MILSIDLVTADSHIVRIEPKHGITEPEKLAIERHWTYIYRATPALLGCPKDYCSFEFVFMANTSWALEMVEAHDIALRKKFGDEIRAHWGEVALWFRRESGVPLIVQFIIMLVRLLPREE